MADQELSNPKAITHDHAHDHDHEHDKDHGHTHDVPAEEAGLPANTVTMEDAGAARKKISISVPAERVAAKIKQVYKELHKDAVIPGFRRGRVPQRILEKRFGTNARDTIKAQLISDSYESAVKQNDLEVLGQPEIDVTKIEVPESGPMLMDIFVEVMPEFALPDLTGMEVTKPLLQPTEERFQLALQTLAKNLGHWSPATEPAQLHDLITAGVEVLGEDGATLAPLNPMMVMVEPGSLFGVRFEDLADRLKGVTPSSTLEFAGTVPETYQDERLRGRTIKIIMKVTTIEREHIPELNDKLARENGFNDLADLHAAMRDALQTRLASEIDRITQTQVLNQLLERTSLDLPAKVSARQNESVLRRRATELLQRGVPLTEIQKHIEELKAMSAQEAARDLKVAFIVHRLAQQFDITGTAAELNAEVAAIAAQYGRRPEKLRQELAADGRLDDLFQQLMQRKVLSHLVSLAKVVEVDEAAWNEKMRLASTPAAGLNVTGLPLSDASSAQNAT